MKKRRRRSALRWPILALALLLAQHLAAWLLHGSDPLAAWIDGSYLVALLAGFIVLARLALLWLAVPLALLALAARVLEVIRGCRRSSH